MTGASRHPVNSLAHPFRPPRKPGIYRWWSFSFDLGLHYHHGLSGIAEFIGVSTITLYRHTNGQIGPFKIGGFVFDRGTSPPAYCLPKSERPRAPRIHRPGEPLLGRGHITHPSGCTRN